MKEVPEFPFSEILHFVQRGGIGSTRGIHNKLVVVEGSCVKELKVLVGSDRLGSVCLT